MAVSGKDGMVSGKKVTTGRMVGSGKADGHVDIEMDGAMMGGRRIYPTTMLSQFLSWKLGSMVRINGS